jgi:hypothetical protein
VELTTSQKGAIAEAKITARAVELGIGVLRPVVEGVRYDLVFDHDGRRLVRVQCKWARVDGDVVGIRIGTCRHTPNGYVRTTYSANEVDAVVAYCAALDEVYYLPIEKVAGMTHVHLRLRPARNNQQLGVTMAADHVFGAVAQLGERRTGSAEATGSSPVSSTL